MPELPPLVVDANVVISATLADGVARRLLRDQRLVLYAPQHLWVEVEASLDVVCSRARLLRRDVLILWAGLRERILTVPAPVVARHHEEALRRLASGDVTDAPYLATALAVRGALWTDDMAFKKRAGVEGLSTDEILRRLDSP